MSSSRLLGALAVLAGVAVAAALGWIAWLWYDSRLPGSYDVMDYAAADYGGAPHAAQMAARSLERFDGPREGKPDFQATLIAQQATVRLSSGMKIDAWTFNGRVPGPELRVHQGDLVAITLVNRDIDGGASIHWHGVDVPNREDGVSGVTQDALRPGESYTYRFRATQVGTFWYHTYQNAAKGVRRGLYGALVILPRPRLSLPAKPASDPVAVDLVVAVHSFPGVVAIGLNDGLDRLALAPGTRVRLRLLNTDSSAQKLVLDGTPFRVAAIDGTEISRPREVEDQAIELGAGARYDVVYTMPAHPVQLGVAGSHTALVLGPQGEGEVPTVRAGPTFDPAGYGTATTPFDASSHFDRSFEVDLRRKVGFVDGRPGRHWSVNGKLFPRTPMYVVRRGDLVRMTISNHSGAAHPMHLHGHHFLVLSRNGKRLTGSAWWVDTLNVQDGERYEVGFRATNPGVWMFHCHNLPHAADGLTMHVVYEGVTTPFRAGDAAHNHPE
jgi:FtsP/CotA-like multicopper oxidase with cupredoxin domain